MTAWISNNILKLEKHVLKKIIRYCTDTILAARPLQWEVKFNITLYIVLVAVDSTTILDKGR